MNICSQFTDEMLIDSILQKLPPPETEQLRNHLRHCDTCTRRYDEWQSLLETNRDTLSKHGALKQRLMESVTHTNKRPRKRWRPQTAFVGFGLATLAIFVFIIYQIQPEYQQSNYTAIQNDLSDRDTFIADPRTIQYEVTSARPESIRGGVWVNDTTKEMLVHIEGLPHVFHKDYQVWFVNTNNEWYGEVLQLQNGKAVMYVYGDGIKYIHHVRTSLEPKGGSPRPTGEETFFIELKR